MFLDQGFSSLEHFQQQFGTEEACAEYLFLSKWPDGFSCPRCGHRHASRIGTRKLPLFECHDCRHQSSLTSGTIMEGSRTDLRKWFTAFFLVSRTERGTSAVELREIISVTYKTAWLILRKIRHAISHAEGQTFLSGIARVNAAVYGKPHNPTIHRHPQEQPLLVGASINDQGEPIYVKIKLVPDSHIRHRQVQHSGTRDFADRNVETLTTDIEFVTGRFSPLRFRSLLHLASKASQWINETFHGLGRKHLQTYLDEYSFRLNLSLRKVPIFLELTRLCVAASPVSYSTLTRRVALNRLMRDKYL